MVKESRPYDQQVELLAQRGMDVGDRREAVAMVRRVNYYRLSGYWYPFRKQAETGRHDDFFPGARLSDVVSLYDFDARLRAAAVSTLAPIELAIRAPLGHELGKVDPCAHLDPSKLGATARSGAGYHRWLTLIQFLLDRLQAGRKTLLPAVVKSFRLFQQSRSCTWVRRPTGRARARWLTRTKQTERTSDRVAEREPPKTRRGGRVTVTRVQRLARDHRDRSVGRAGSRASAGWP